MIVIIYNINIHTPKNLVLFLILGFILEGDNVEVDKIDAYSSINVSYNITSTRKSISKYLGVIYVYGGNSLKTGIDCSGLINIIYKEEFNKKLPRTANSISYLGKEISIDSLKRGDLLFFGTKYKITHVAMYLSDNNIIQAVSKGSQIDSIGNNVWNSYWKRRYVFSKRIIM